MERQKFAGWVYLALVVAAAFALGYFAGGADRAAEVQVTVAAPVQETSVQSVAAQTPAAEEAAPPEILDLNTADQAALETLPGIGPELAGRIIAYRQTIGRFVSKEQIMDVEGIGEKRYAEMEQLITVEVTHENSGG